MPKACTAIHTIQSLWMWITSYPPWNPLLKAPQTILPFVPSSFVHLLNFNTLLQDGQQILGDPYLTSP